MWIRRRTYDSIMERIADLERYNFNHSAARALHENEKLRDEIAGLRKQVALLVESLGLVHQYTPSRETFVKKGGPERG